MKLFLCLVGFFICFLKISFSSPAGMPTRDDKNELRNVFNISGVLSLRPSTNITQSSPISVQISGFIDLVFPSSEAFGLKKYKGPESSGIPNEELMPIFRKDYTLDEQNRGWFKLHRVPEKWDDARERCELEGAELASPLDATIYQAMVSKMDRGLSRYYTGIHSLFSYGDYYSLKGVSVEEMPVEWSYHLSSDKEKRCVELLDDGTINNVNCASTLPYICYKNNDFTPLTECGTIDTEYFYSSQLNACYKLHKTRKSWEKAYKTCSAEGGSLTVINDDKELAAVLQLFNKDSAAENDLQYSVFIGIINWQLSGEWVTIHGEKIEMSGFSIWSPNGMYSGNCGALQRSGLIGVNCDQAFPFVCERNL